MSKRFVIAAAVSTTAAAMVAAVGTGAASPGAQKSVSYTSCNIGGKQRQLGASYVTSLKVAGVSCSKGEKVIKNYHQCRHSNGGAGGSCGATVLGFKCHDGKRSEVPDVQYSTTAKCHKKSNSDKRVKSAYTQNI